MSRRSRITLGTTLVSVVAAIAVVLALGAAPFGGNGADDHGAAPDEPLGDDGPSSAVTTAEVAPSTEPEPETITGTLIMWRPNGLAVEVAAEVAQLDHVVSAVGTRSDTLGLVGSRDAGGATVDAPPAGYRIPVNVVAVDPVTYPASIPPDLFPGADQARTTISALRPGEVLLSETGASLRGGSGAIAELDLIDLPGLRVVGVVPDQAVRNAEIIAHIADADTLDLPERGLLTVRYEATSEDEVVALIGELEQVAARAAEQAGIDAGEVPTGIVRAGAERGRGEAPLVLPLMEIKARFGEFPFRPHARGRDIDVSASWANANIVAARVPLLGTVRCHRLIVDDLGAALQEIADAGLGAHIDPRNYAGCHYARRINPERNRLSSHSWGIAVDIGVDMSRPGMGAIPPDEIIEIFGRHGFRWGGDFSTPDNHHWEWVGEAARHRPAR